MSGNNIAGFQPHDLLDPGSEKDYDEMELDPDKVRKGRKDEMEFMTKIDMFEFVKTAKCWERTGAAPISTRWVEGEKKHDDGELIVRCRLVEKDREDLYAAMLPL